MVLFLLTRKLTYTHWNEFNYWKCMFLLVLYSQKPSLFWNYKNIQKYMTMGFKHTYAYFEAEISEILSLLSRNQIYLMLIKKECTKLLKRTEPFQITTVHHIELKFEPFPGFSLWGTVRASYYHGFPPITEHKLNVY